MRVLKGTTKNEPIDAVKPHPKNPRQGDVGAIHQSIENNGFYGSIVAQKSTGFILAGNHRWQAARHLEAKTVPVTWLDVDDDHALRILLADNRTNDLASYDDAALTDLLKELHAATGTLAGTGYDGDDLDTLLGDLRMAEEKSFMSDLANAEDSDDEKEKIELPGSNEDYVTIAYTYTGPEREEIIAKLKRVMSNHNLPTQAQALLHIVRAAKEK